MTALGVIAGILVLALLYAVSMYVYFVLRRRHAAAKFLVEVGTVFFAIVLSIAVKLVILLLTTAPDFSGGFASALIAIYSAIGGLTFEGISSVAELGGFLNCLYAGTSLYAGLIALSVITARASYEIYSFIALRFLNLRNQNKTDIYIFMTVTDDAVLLANSVKEQACYASGERRCVIVFTGSEIGVFDRKNPLHREIMSRGYLYWEYSNAKDGTAEPSVLRRLRLYAANDRAAFPEEAQTGKKGEKSALQDVRIYIFALGLRGDLIGSESSNSEIIGEEMRAIAREMAEGSAPSCVADFYLLIESEINYSFYTDMTKRLISEAFRECGSEKKAEDFYHCFQLHVLSEPKLAARCLAKNRNAVFAKDEKLYLSDNAPGERNVYRAIVLGFGKTGQMAMNAVFTDTAYTNKQGVPSQFFADVYDLKMDELAGLFSIEHPLYQCATRMEEIEPFSEEEFAEASAQSRRKIERFYEPLLAARGKGETFADIVRGMKFPWITFHKASCFQTRFMRYLDGESGVAGERREKNKLLCNAFIIALGDDEANIKMANSLIDDLKHESAFTNKRSSVYPQMIYVNLRDEKNYNRINWTPEDEKEFTAFKVILFGNRVEMYSYGQIIDDSADMEYDYAYGALYGGGSSQEAYEAFSNIKKCIEEGRENENFSGDIKKAVDALKNIKKTPEELRRNWLNVTLFNKESNYAANRFKPFMAHALRSEPLTGGRLVELARLEHVRWCRFHMAYGWTYRLYDASDKATKNRYRRIREHNILCPFEMLSADMRVNNLVNVALAAEDQPIR